ncbi:MAG: hypothetical protein HY567_00365, partial [Candidatus Kerfeldbacteria bacterium]|nr:hypothetical protein [Candidatus Kerfeldbacteria bacterium]
MKLKNKIILGAAATVITVIGLWGFYRAGWISAGRENINPGETAKPKIGGDNLGPAVETVFPANGAVLAEPPEEITIGFS